MRVMVIIKANAVSEAGVLPGEKMLTEMGKFNEELVKSGVMLAGEGLHPSSKGKRVRFSGTQKTVIDGPLQDGDLEARPSKRYRGGQPADACAGHRDPSR